MISIGGSLDLHITIPQLFRIIIMTFYYVKGILAIAKPCSVVVNVKESYLEQKESPKSMHTCMKFC